jgi:hypothetical protein
MIARHVLRTQFSHLGIVSYEEDSSDLLKFESLFKNGKYYRIQATFPFFFEEKEPVRFSKMKTNLILLLAWADNADTMSEQYTGTGALKNDFTRTGKRSVKGIAADGINSMKRYINKTFQFDDLRQASMDIFLGKFIIGKIHFVSIAILIFRIFFKPFLLAGCR